MGLTFQNPSFTILCKIAFWLNKELIIHGVGCPGKKGSLFDGTALKNDKFHLQANVLLDGTEPACIHHLLSLLGKNASPLHKMPIEVGHSILGLHIIRNLAEEKINMVNMFTK